MGGSSSKKTFFWQKRKKSPVNKAWSHLKGALPTKKRKRTSIVDRLRLDNLRREKKHSQRGFSLKGHRKEPTLVEKLGNLRKESVHDVLKENGKGGERKKLSLTVNTKEEKEINGPQHRPRESKHKLTEFFKSIHS